MPPRIHARQGRVALACALACALLACKTAWLHAPQASAPRSHAIETVIKSGKEPSPAPAIAGNIADLRSEEPVPDSGRRGGAAWIGRGVRPAIPRAEILAAARGETDTIAFSLSEGRYQTEGTVERLLRRSTDSFTLIGSLPGKRTAGSWSLAVRNEITVANFRLPDGGPCLEWRVNPDGSPVEHEILADRMPPCDAFAPEPPPMAGDSPPPTRPLAPLPGATRGPTAPPPVFADDPAAVPELAILVVYTPAAVAAAGGPLAMEALVYLSIDETNAALADSLAQPRVRLVHHQVLPYTETATDMRTDLYRLRSADDSYLNEVHQLRETVGADLVNLVVVNSLTCGLAYTLVSNTQDFADYAFSVVAEDCMATNYSFSHEIAHNLGCQHAAGDDEGMVVQGQGIFPFSHGWRFEASTVDGTLYRTIMAQTPGSRVPYFSNPDLLVAETPAGVANLADNVRTLNLIAPAAALWKDTPRILFGAALGQADWIFQSGGDAPWTEQPIERRDGPNALQAGFVPDDGTSWLQTILEGPIQVDFFWKVEFSDPAAALAVSVDGVEYGRIGNGTGWKRQMIRLPSGSHVVRWTQKRGNTGDSFDAVAWLDSVRATPVPLVIQGFRATGNPVEAIDLRFESIPFQDYVLEWSPDLSDWRSIRPLRPTDPADTFTDVHVPMSQIVPAVEGKNAAFRVRMME